MSLSRRNADGLKWKEKFLRVKRAAFGREGVGLQSRIETHVSRSQQVERRDTGDSLIQRCPVKGDRVLSYKDVLQGSEKEMDGFGRLRGRELPSIVISGESFGVDRLRRSFVIELTNGRCVGIQASDLLSDLGVEAFVVKIGRGVSMQPWSDGLILKPFREVWITCFRISLHTRCPNTFLSIGHRWGEVLTIEFDSLERRLMDDGRVNILTNIMTPLNFAFKLMINGKAFDCRVVEESPVSLSRLQDRVDPARSPGHELSREVKQNQGLELDVGAAMADPEEKRRSPCSGEMFFSAESDSTQESEVACKDVVLATFLNNDGGGIEEVKGCKLARLTKEGSVGVGAFSSKADGVSIIFDVPLCFDGGGLEDGMLNSPLRCPDARCEDGGFGDGCIGNGPGPIAAGGEGRFEIGSKNMEIVGPFAYREGIFESGLMELEGDASILGTRPGDGDRGVGDGM
ncbi:hypothetical protein Dimus_005376 [Dionaea muscipula]